MSKYCIDCKHFNRTIVYDLCCRPLGISVVTGKPKFNQLIAETERTLDLIGCGPDGKYFEPVETIEEIPFGGQAK
jgi:hypothetical protein